MAIKEKLVGSHIIYGEWDDCSGNEVLVYYHPAGLDCHVFVMAGQDYGGGISSHGTVPVHEVEKSLIAANGDSYEFHKKMEELTKL